MQGSMQELEEKTAKEIAKLTVTLSEKSPTQIYSEVQSMIGMDKAKENMLTFIRRRQLEKEREKFNMRSAKGGYHTVFYGNSGTGKTTMAKHRAELMFALGLGGPKYLPLTKENVVGQFIGHTEDKIRQIIDSADQIFFDEAYALSRSDSPRDFGFVIIDALMTRMENDRDKLIVMFAGYTDEMDQFLSSNPGFKSRISYYESLPDYTPEQLAEILEKKLEANEYIINSDAKDMAMEQMDKLKSKVGVKHFGNARLARTVAELAPDKIADRLFPDILSVDFTKAAQPAAYGSGNRVEEMEKAGSLSRSKGGIILINEGVKIDLERDFMSAEALELKTVRVEDIRALDIPNMNVKKLEARRIGF